MTSRMIRPRPSAFSHYFVKSIYSHNLKPHLHPKNQNKGTNNIVNTQKRHNSTHSPKEPNNGPPFWLLVVTGIYVTYNIQNPPKKKN